MGQYDTLNSSIQEHKFSTTASKGPQIKTTFPLAIRIQVDLFDE